MCQNIAAITSSRAAVGSFQSMPFAFRHHRTSNSPKQHATPRSSTQLPEAAPTPRSGTNSPKRHQLPEAAPTPRSGTNSPKRHQFSGHNANHHQERAIDFPSIKPEEQSAGPRPYFAFVSKSDSERQPPDSTRARHTLNGLTTPSCRAINPNSGIRILRSVRWAGPSLPEAGPSLPEAGPSLPEAGPSLPEADDS
jgi:hypothetical protein